MSKVIFLIVLLSVMSRAYDDELSETTSTELPTPDESPGAGAALCEAGSISSGLVTSCVCQAGSEKFTSCQNEKYGLAICNMVCGFDNRNAEACELWYYGVCNCLQNLAAGQTTNCVPDKPWAGAGIPPVWILRISANLISSTVLNTGVENLASMPDKNGGWTLGLNNLTPTMQGLTMNSQNTRTENQIHIHRCPVNANAVNVLSKLTPADYVLFKSVPGTTWYCKVEVLGATIAPSSDVLAFLKTTPSIDITNVGIGVIPANNFRWVCISTTKADVAEYTFCH